MKQFFRLVLAFISAGFLVFGIAGLAMPPSDINIVVMLVGFGFGIHFAIVGAKL